MKPWYNEWFNSPYYHILYNNHDEKEAQFFIDNLVAFFNLQPNHKVLDMACGRGRYSVYIHKKGFDVVGFDLSAESIAYAKQFESERLQFYIHDMREPFGAHQFDYVLNMFTSMGYFDTDEENKQVVVSAAKCIKPGGSLLIDFLNPYKVIQNLEPEGTAEREGITFHFTKKIDDASYIIKDIRFNDQGKSFHFIEKVKAIRQVEFMDYFRAANLKLTHTFGNYSLEPFDRETSDRMIFILKK